MNPEETPKETPQTPPPQQEPEKPSKSRPVKVYLIALFCAAVLLLLISFVMQQRNHMALQDLNDSLTNTQEITDLQLENQRLQYELEGKEEEAKDLQSQAEEKDRQVQALEWLRQIEGAVRRSYSEAIALVEAFEETGLPESLPTESSVEGAESPADAYRTIYAMFF